MSTDRPDSDRAVSSAGGDVHEWGPLVGDLAHRKARALEMGGTDLVARQHSLGKLTVRERLEILVDEGTWVEYGLTIRVGRTDRDYAGVEYPRIPSTSSAKKRSAISSVSRPGWSQV